MCTRRVGTCCAVADLALLPLGCGRTLPHSEFQLRVEDRNPGWSGLAPVFVFTYSGKESLEDVDLTLSVRTHTGKTSTVNFYQADWPAGGNKRFQITDLYEQPQKVTLTGTARLGKESVRIGVEWMMKTSGR
jgi:hypothetical protein